MVNKLRTVAIIKKPEVPIHKFLIGVINIPNSNDWATTNELIIIN